MDLGQMPLNPEKMVSKVQMKININQTKVLSHINGQNIEDVDQFVYLGKLGRQDSFNDFDVA